ncbi:MAG: hypothetical protein V8R80_03015 [Eubacterium sp.]
MKPKKGMTLIAKQRAAGWVFLAPASIMIAVMSFPMVKAFLLSLQTGKGTNYTLPVSQVLRECSRTEYFSVL